MRTSREPLRHRERRRRLAAGPSLHSSQGSWLESRPTARARGSRPSGTTGAAARRTDPLALPGARRSRRAAGRSPARSRSRTWRPRCLADEEPPRLPRGAVRRVVGRPRRGADQRPAASRGSRVHRRPRRSRGDDRDRRLGRKRRAARGPLARDARAGDAPLRRRARRRPHRRRATRADRPRVALLHLGHHRAAQGRDAHAPQPGDDDGVLLHRRRRRRSGRRDRVRRADVARRRPLQPALRRPRGTPCRARVGRLRSARAARAVARGRAPLPVRGADDGAAPRRARRRRRRAVRRLQDDRLRRRPHVRPGHPARAPRWERASSRSTARANRR